MMCLQQGAIEMEAGYLILLVMCVLHHQRVQLPLYNNVHTLNKFSMQPTVVILRLPQMAILNLSQALQKVQRLSEFICARTDK